MEACAGSYHWARQLQAGGLRVKLMAPQFVKPYVKSNKNDANDAEAICEAMSRPSMRFVSVRSVEQQDIQAVHRIPASENPWRTDTSSFASPWNFTPDPGNFSAMKGRVALVFVLLATVWHGWTVWEKWEQAQTFPRGPDFTSYYYAVKVAQNGTTRTARPS